MIVLVVVAWTGVVVTALLWTRSWARWLRLRRRPLLDCDQLASVKDGSPVTVGGTTAPDAGRVVVDGPGVTKTAVKVRGGRTVLRLGPFRKVGTARLQVRYSGSELVERERAVVKVRVRRR